MKKYMLAIALFSINTYGATTTLSWSGVVPSVADTPINVEVNKGAVHFDIYGEHIELPLNSLGAEFLVTPTSTVPVLSLDL